MEEAQTTGKRLSTREDWIRAASDLLLAGGVAAVKVEVVAMHLGLSKGSFYHHFNSRRDLLDALLEDWRKRTTDDVLERLEGVEDPCEFLCEIVNIVIGDGLGRWTPALYAWALQDEEIAVRLREMHIYRLERMVELFRRAGLDPTSAERRARVFFYLVHGITAMPWQAEMDPDETIGWLKRVVRALTHCPPKPSDPAFGLVGTDPEE